MRYGPDHKQRTRRRIVAAAGARFRAGGYAAVGVDEVMRAAGLTAGGFYAHFPSKRALLAESLGLSLARIREVLLCGLEGVAGPDLLRAVVGRYLSRSHRDAPATGCPLPSLAAEIAREQGPARGALDRYLGSLCEELEPRTPPAPGLSPADRVLATAALLAGAMLLARAVSDAALSERILRSARRLAVPELAARAADDEARRARAAALPLARPTAGRSSKAPGPRRRR